MTLSKRSQRSRSLKAKAVPRRAVSFCPSAKPEAPSRSKANADKALQSVDKRRRYMRRGSKCPSMLRASFVKISPLLQGYAATNDFAPLPLPVDSQPMDYKTLNRKQRRLSLMTALKISLENTSIVDTASTKPQRMERRLSASYQFISPV